MPHVCAARDLAGWDDDLFRFFAIGAAQWAGENDDDWEDDDEDWDDDDWEDDDDEDWDDDDEDWDEDDWEEDDG